MELTVSNLNKLKKFGERVVVDNVGQEMTVLRVPGGYIFEYYDTLFDEGENCKVTAAVFISTDELRNE